ncbi:hypothetical protein V6N13_096945 [Hibiscus sabdariffa]
MPESGSEETGVKPVFEQLSEYNAGIPIKKRRFALIWPPTEDSPLLPTESDSEKKGNFCPLQHSTTSNDIMVGSSLNTSGVEASLDTSVASGSSNIRGVAVCSNVSSCAASFNDYCVALTPTAISLKAGSNAGSAVETSNGCSVASSFTNVSGITASVSSFSSESEKTAPEKEERNSGDTSGSLLQGNSNLLRVELEEQSFMVHSRSFADMECRGKHLETGESENIPRKSAKSELDLDGNGSLILKLGNDTYNQQNIDGKCRLQLPTVSGSPGLSLGVKECISAMASESNEHCFQSQKKADPVSLNLSLSKGECSTQHRSTEVHPNTYGASVLVDKRNWDLNTTMDSWEGLTSDDAASQTTSHINDFKQFSCSSGMTVTSMLTQQEILEEAEQRDKNAIPFMPYSNEKPSSSLAKVDSSKFVANISSSGESVPVSKLSTVNIKPVKSESLDESIKISSAGVKAKPMAFLNTAKVKCESVENCSSVSSKSSTLCLFNIVDARSIKPEAECAGNQEIPKRMEGLLNQSDKQMLHPRDDTTVPGLSLHGNASTHVEHFIQDKGIEPSVEASVASEVISSAGHDDNELQISGKIDNSTSQNKNAEDPNQWGPKYMDVQLPDPRVTVEGSVYDEEKINVPGDILENDSYSSDYESDGKRELSAAMDIKLVGGTEDDFEDGEVRDPTENTEIEIPICERREEGIGVDSDTGYRNSDVVGFSGNKNQSSSSVKEETQREDPVKTSCDDCNECIGTSVNNDSTRKFDEEVCLSESSAVEMSSYQIDKRGPIKAMPIKSHYVSEEKDSIKGQEGMQTSIQTSDSSPVTPVTIAQGADYAIKTDSEGKNNLVLPAAEAFLNDDDSSKDVNDGVNRSRSRIINISRASNLSNSGRTRPISVRTLQSQVGREKLHVTLKGDNCHPWGRGEASDDGSHRFSRERHQYQPSRNNRISFMHRRDLSFSHNNGQDVADDSSNSPGLPPRRWSHGGRDGFAARNLPMVRRVPRNLSPSRCIGEDGSDLVGLRHMRGFVDYHTDRMFACCQPSFEGLDDTFDRMNREFSSVQRRGLPHTRSKSPTRPQTRSPGPWSSIRRRSPDVFAGPLELPRQRSPPIYRIKRIRSPDRPCFAGEMAFRRHGSPPYLPQPSNDSRDLDSCQDHGHPRSGIPDRGSSSRVLHGNNIRLDLVDPRERNDSDAYFDRAMPSGRFRGLGADGNADERRYGDRRGPVRPFRPPYSGTDSENCHLNAKAGPRSFRFRPEDDSNLNERGNRNENDFD